MSRAHDAASGSTGSSQTESARPSATHVVLVHPEIHWNTGNAGRTCLATGATLHLIEPLGFSLDDREVKRAGLDYWEHIELRVWPSWAAFETQLPTLGEPYFFSTKATRLALGRAPRRIEWRRPRLRARDRRASIRASRAISRSVCRDADPVAARPVTQPVDERGDRGVRGAPAAAVQEPRVIDFHRNDPGRMLEVFGEGETLDGD